MSTVHPMARTTPRTRAEIHDSTASLSSICQTYNISRSTARKWRNRNNPQDRSHRAHQLHTTLSPAQELIVLEIRRLRQLLLDDLVWVSEVVKQTRFASAAELETTGGFKLEVPAG